MEQIPDSSSLKLRIPKSIRAELEPLVAKALRALREPSWFPTPGAIAAEAGIDIRIVHALPGVRTELTNGALVLALWHDDQRKRGTRLFRGIASALLERTRGRHTAIEATFLASQLAGPPALVRRVGIDEAVRHQTWVEEDFLRSWYALT